MGQWHCTANGAKYGPVELDVLRQWIVEGRVGPAELVWTEGMPAWQPAASVPELASAATDVAGGPIVGPGFAYPQYYYPAALPNASGTVPSLVCGIIATALGCFCIGTIVSLVLGMLAIAAGKSARGDIAASPQSYGGRGMATAGLVLGIIGLCLGVLDFVYLVFTIAVFRF